MAYNLQYMFREDVGRAKKKFHEALSQNEPGVHQPFGDVRDMFDSLLEKSLKLYGKEGLVNQEQVCLLLSGPLLVPWHPCSAL